MAMHDPEVSFSFLIVSSFGNLVLHYPQDNQLCMHNNVERLQYLTNDHINFNFNVNFTPVQSKTKMFHFIVLYLRHS